MLLLTKIFHFEMAHAIYRYEGSCNHIHGHSYELHVSVTNGKSGHNYIPAPGLIMDFKELKRIVNSSVLYHFDHRLLLSEEYLNSQQALASQESLFITEAEPTVENLLLFIYTKLKNELPAGVQLAALKLYETKDSYAEWVNTTTDN